MKHVDGIQPQVIGCCQVHITLGMLRSEGKRPSLLYCRAVVTMHCTLFVLTVQGVHRVTEQGACEVTVQGTCEVAVQGTREVVVQGACEVAVQGT